MGRFRNKKKNVVVKSITKNNQQLPTVDQVTGKKIPQTMVFSRNKAKRLPPLLRQLEQDLRKVMLPYTALKLKEKKRNSLKDFVNVAGPMGVTHFLILSKTINPYLRIAKTPQGPTLTFKIHNYSLAVDVAQSQLRPRCPADLFKNSPLLVLSGFGSQEEHLRLTSTMFQNMFPTIDVNTVKLSLCQRIVLLNYNKETKLIEFRHYSIRLQPVGVSRRIRNIVQNRQLPDLSSLKDVSEFVTRAGYGSESEGDDEAATVSLVNDLGRVNRASTKSAVKLQEIGPRMTLELTKIEGGLCSGEVMFSLDGKNDDKRDGNVDEEGEEEEDEDEDGDEEGGEEEDDDDEMEDSEDGESHEEEVE